MAQTTTKTSTRTKALAAVGVVAALGLIGWAAAVMSTKLVKKPDLVATISDIEDPLLASTEQWSYHITVKNQGSATATNVKLSNLLPEHFEYSVVNTLMAPGFTCSYVETAETIYCSGGSIAAGQSAIFFVTGVPNDSVIGHSCAFSDTDTNTVTVDPDKNIAESNETNNKTTETIEVNGRSCPDLVVQSGYMYIVVGDEDPYDLFANSVDYASLPSEMHMLYEINNIGHDDADTIQIDANFDGERLNFNSTVAWTYDDVLEVRTNYSCSQALDGTVTCTGSLPKDEFTMLSLRIDKEEFQVSCGESKTFTQVVTATDLNTVDPEVITDNNSYTTSFTVVGPDCVVADFLKPTL